MIAEDAAAMERIEEASPVGERDLNLDDLATIWFQINPTAILKTQLE
jgi:hypothetical protein